MAPFTPQMVTVYDPVSGLPQGTVMMMMPSPPSGAGLPQGTETMTTHSVQSPPIGSGVPQGTVTMDSVQSPPISTDPPQRKDGVQKRRRRDPFMDPELKKEIRRQSNKIHAKTFREKNKNYVASLKSRVEVMEVDNKQLLERLQCLEMFCRVHGFST